MGVVKKNTTAADLSTDDMVFGHPELTRIIWLWLSASEELTDSPVTGSKVFDYLPETKFINEPIIVIEVKEPSVFYTAFQIVAIKIPVIWHSGILDADKFKSESAFVEDLLDRLKHFFPLINGYNQIDIPEYLSLDAFNAGIKFADPVGAD